MLLMTQNVKTAKNALELAEMNQATSLRQTAEWGMRQVQGAFPRLTDKIKFERNGERRIYLMLACLLYNMRLELVGLNQIRNTYCPLWSKDADFLMSSAGGY